MLAKAPVQRNSSCALPVVVVDVDSAFATVPTSDQLAGRSEEIVERVKHRLGSLDYNLRSDLDRIGFRRVLGLMHRLAHCRSILISRIVERLNRLDRGVTQ